jgi:hypothetical protein
MTASLVPAFAQDWAGTATLGIRARGADGPLVGAFVSITAKDPGFSGGPPARRTNERGEVNFVGLASGSWTLEIRHADHLTYIGSVRIAPGKKPMVTAEFLQATGAGRLTMRVKYLKSISGPRGSEVPPAASTAVRASATARDTEARSADKVAPPVAGVPGTEEPSGRGPSAAALPAGRTDTPGEISPEEVDESLAPPSRAGAISDPAPSVPVGSVEEPSRPERPASPPAPSADGAGPAAATAPENETPPQVDATGPAPPVDSRSQVPKAAVAAKPILAPATPPPPAPAPVQPTEPADSAAGDETAPTPAPRPGTPDETPTAAVEPSLAPPVPERSALRSYRDRTCFECKPGEWAVASAVEAAATSAAGCPSDAAELAHRAMEQVTREASGRLARYGGPLPDSLARLDLGPSCRLVVAVLPGESRFSGFRFEVIGPRARGECRGAGGCEIGEASWLFDAQVRSSAGATFVYSVFENLSPTERRKAILTAYFLPPGDWLSAP